jgi:DNA-directed RNA polymerase specialized sigma24 family protein
MSPDHLAIVAALRKIPADQRLAIVLYHYANLSVGEIAAETGAPPNTVKARLARGRKALAAQLTEFAESLDKPRPVRIANPSQISRREI